jgi:hypothetical protein
MPEASVNEDADAASDEYEVRLPREIRYMQAISKSPAVKIAAHNEFWAGILRTYPRHVSASDNWRHTVHSVAALLRCNSQ